MIRGVIFDLGHTIWDIALGDGESLAKAYAGFRENAAQTTGRTDLPAADAIQRAVTEALVADAETYLATGPVLEQPPTHHWVDLGCRSLGLVLEEALLQELTPPLFATEVDRLVVHDGTLEAIHALANGGVRVGCVTNTLADASTIGLMLRNHDLLEVMGSVVVSSEEGFRKPHPALFEKAMRELSVAVEEALFVGDSPYHDVGGAKAVGMWTALTRQYLTRPWIEGVPAPDATIDHLRELPSAIDAIDTNTRVARP
jgi:FMN phosphatase YigB (HAD superfamily)